MEKYFVVSDGESPNCIYFSLEDAKEFEPYFIDSFNENGEKVAVYETDEVFKAYIRTPIR